jgi:hypothetical protein
MCQFKYDWHSEHAFQNVNGGNTVMLFKMYMVAIPFEVQAPQKPALDSCRNCGGNTVMLFKMQMVAIH